MFGKKWKRIIMTYHDFGKMLNDLKKSYEQRYPLGSMTFDDTMTVGEGDSDGKNPLILKIGVKGLNLESSLLVNEKIFMNVLVATYHEMHHAKQYAELYRKSDEKNSLMAVSYTADISNLYPSVPVKKTLISISGEMNLR